MPDENRTNDEINKKPNQEKDTEIPLWLQGIDENEVEETKQTPPVEDQPTDRWIKEIDEDLHLGETGTSIQEENTQKSDLPEWIDQVSNEDENTPTISALSDEESGLDMDQIQEGDLDNRAIGIEHDLEHANNETNGFSEIIDEAQNEMPGDGGFIEISELSEVEEQDLSDLDENLSDEEELPEWLKEMIHEPDPNLTTDVKEDLIDTLAEIDEENEILFDEPTQPVFTLTDESTSEEPILTENAEQVWITENEPVDIEQVPLEDHTGQPEQEAVIVETIESTPIPEPADKKSFLDELPEDMLIGKSLLEKDQFSDAMRIFMNHADNPVLNNQIQAWLQESIEGQEETSSDLWEFLGDLKLKNDDSEGALSAYTDAINQLLQRKRDDHEID